MQLIIGSDHAGFELKEQLKKHFPEFSWIDVGSSSSESVDYPDYADKVCTLLKESNLGLKSEALDSHLSSTKAILICGSGQGMSIRANKYSHIRAALCWTEEVAKLSRAHNDANVLCLGSRFLNLTQAAGILRIFLSTEFEGGRHQKRKEKLSLAT